MKKNQKYTQEEMFLAIEYWKESGLPQKKYCVQNHLSFSTFKYWQKKYQKAQIGEEPKSSRSFIPVHIPRPTPQVNELPIDHTEGITIWYPNGIKLSCPVDIAIEQLRTLIKL